MAKGKRREGRITALMFLFGADISSSTSRVVDSDLDAELERFWEFRPARASIKEHATRLIRGVLEKRPELDKILETAVQNYAVQRLAPVDRNIMRLALYEMAFEESVPDAVAINEAVEVAADYGDSKSGAFVNGILDGVRRSKALAAITEQA